MSMKLFTKFIFLIPLFIFHLNASTRTTGLGVDASTAVFIDQNQFYVGTGADNSEMAISALELSTPNGVLTANFVGKVPARGITVNGTAQQPSTMNNQVITKLASTAVDSSHPTKYLVAAHSLPVGISTSNVKSVSVIDTANKKETSNTNDLKNANGGVVNTPYAALAASTDNVFVVVPGDGGIFGAANSGIVRLNIGTAGLATQLNRGQANAYKIDLTALNTEYSGQSVDSGIPIRTVIARSASSGVNFTLGAIADLWWDQKLQRLYLALVNAVGPAKKDAGVCTLLVGRIDSLLGCCFQPAISVYGASSPILQLDAANNMVGYHAGDTSKTSVSTFKVRTMHTSTGRDYAIVVGDVITVDAGDPDKYLTTQVNVYALPLVYGGGVDAEKNGMIAQKNSSVSGGIDFTKPVAGSGTMLSKTADKAMVTVGVDPQYLVHSSEAAILKNAAITDIQVVGDTVYVSLAGNRKAVGPGSDSSEAGIFASTAIFNQYRTVRAWTPWQRVLGIADQVYNFGFDKNTNNFWYVGGPVDGTTNKQTGSVTGWSAGDGIVVHPGGTLSAALQDAFNDDFGIINLVDFDDETEGFAPWTPASGYPNFSMMVATGYNQVALIQTGQLDSTTNVFNPTVAFAKDQNVFIQTLDEDVADVGAISCAEVSRSTVGNAGWLFVGGSNGVAVLSQKYGSGWDSQDGLPGLTATDFPGAGYSFKMLNPGSGYSFEGVRKLICDGTYLYVLTAKKLFKINMLAKYFRGSSTISVSSDANFKVMADVSSGREFFDVVQIQRASSSGTKQNASFLLATDRGLAFLSDTTPITLNDSYVVDKSGTPFSSGPAIKLDFLSTQRGGKFDNNNANGNLYVTAFDQQMKNLYCYRFDVLYNTNASKINITLFDEPYTEESITQKYFYQIVDLSKMEKPIYINKNASLNAKSSQFAGSVGVMPDPDKFLPITIENFAPISLGYPANKIPSFISTVRDTASGALYIPGDFGLEVCE